jgi:hypothetical protein
VSPTKPAAPVTASLIGPAKAVEALTRDTVKAIAIKDNEFLVFMINSILKL